VSLDPKSSINAAKQATPNTARMVLVMSYYLLC
jgi:hypothetical protein